ncbi:MAG: demethoxyubiquinone hydroxylase family protein, partial [Betaproteobacteria bacterium]|nr:demethoxyubiquinone hydroxylase family protein [Betaproteobacteria bacterium]
MVDRFINLLDQSLRTVFAPHHAARPDPAQG